MDVQSGKLEQIKANEARAELLSRDLSLLSGVLSASGHAETRRLCKPFGRELTERMSCSFFRAESSQYGKRFMSHIPIPGVGPNPNVSRILQKGRAPKGLNGRPLNFIPTSTTPGPDIFKMPPTMQTLSARTVPEQLSGHPRIFGNPEQADLLYTYTRSIAQQIFVLGFLKLLFPTSIAAMKNMVVADYARKKSRIPSARHSSATPDIASEIEATTDHLNLYIPLDQLKSHMRMRRSQILAIADFCLLYGASVVLFCEKDDENRLQALFFLRKLLQLGITARPCEFAILFAILIRQGDADARIRGHSVDVLAQLADHSVDIYSRLEAGSAHHDQVLAAVCTDAVQRTTSRPEALSPPNHEDFPDLPPEAPPDVVAKILTADKEALLQGRGPPIPHCSLETRFTLSRALRMSPLY
jgi:hypothetical protein